MGQDRRPLQTGRTEERGHNRGRHATSLWSRRLLAVRESAMAVGILVTHTGRSPGSSNPRAAANAAAPWSTDTLGGSPSRHDEPSQR